MLPSIILFVLYTHMISLKWHRVEQGQSYLRGVRCLATQPKARFLCRTVFYSIAIVLSGTLFALVSPHVLSSCSTAITWIEDRCHGSITSTSFLMFIRHYSILATCLHAIFSLPFRSGLARSRCLSSTHAITDHGSPSTGTGH
jgi:hypothetical protein